MQYLNQVLLGLKHSGKFIFSSVVWVYTFAIIFPVIDLCGKYACRLIFLWFMFISNINF